jgi:hypothetical protein
MSQRYDKDLTALLVVDPYNDFISPTTSIASSTSLPCSPRDPKAFAQAVVDVTEA